MARRTLRKKRHPPGYFHALTLSAAAAGTKSVDDIVGRSGLKTLGESDGGNRHHIEAKGGAAHDAMKMRMQIRIGAMMMVMSATELKLHGTRAIVDLVDQAGVGKE